jgi:predicted Rossmann fold flavoprotein
VKTIDVLIIGAGPAGLMAGAQIKDKSVLILDQCKKSSLKLLMSGGGQCNFTHTGDLKFFLDQYNNHKAFLKVAFKQFFNEDSRTFMEAAGVPVWTREDGKVFPKTLRAEDVKMALIEANTRLGNKIQTGQRVIEVKALDQGYQVTTDKETYRVTYLIAAFGGCSYPTSGSDGKLFQVFKDLGHSVLALKPALAPIYIEKDPLVDLQGVSFSSKLIECYRDKNKIGTYTGDLLITHFGLSGPVILNNSRNFMPGDLIRIQFGQKNKKALNQYFIEYAQASGKQAIGTAFKGLDYPKRLVDFIMEKRGLKKDMRMSELSKDMRTQLVNALCAYEVRIHHVGGYNVAMATTGGIDLEEVNRKTMASKILQNLYFVGECLDVDGATGGYNIQWAFTSGFIAGQNVDNSSHVS